MTAIKITNRNEYNELMYILNSLGWKWASGHSLANYDAYRKGDAYIFLNDNKGITIDTDAGFVEEVADRIESFSDKRDFLISLSGIRIKYEFPRTSKYKLTNDTIEVEGVILYRIEALVAIDKYGIEPGRRGGYIQSINNLSEYGDAWVSGDARVYGDAKVIGNACVSDNARVYGNAKVAGNARVFDNARVSGQARVYNDARVYGDAMILRNAWVHGGACVCGGVID